MNFLSSLIAVQLVADASRAQQELLSEDMPVNDD